MHTLWNHKSAMRFFKSDVGLALTIAVGWQITFTIIGWLLSPHQPLLAHMVNWDADWYKHIIEYAYGTDGSPAAPAFYPLFPFTVWLITTLSFGLIDQNVVALIINSAALWLILLALLRIAERFILPPSSRFIVILAFLSFPSAFFLHAFYGEAIFLAIGLWAYLFALNKNWRVVGILLAVLTACRLPSALFVALCAFEFARVHDWNVKKMLNVKLLWFALAPLGLVIYSAYLFMVRGDFLAMLHAYSATNDWTYHIFNPNIVSTFYNVFQRVVRSAIGLHPTYDDFINYALPLCCVVVALICSIYIGKRIKPYGLPLLLFGLLSVILYSLNSNLISVHRYLLTCIPLFLAAGLLAERKRERYGIIVLCVISIFVQLFIYMKFVNGIFAG